jgi:hypothetical protein
MPEEDPAAVQAAANAKAAQLAAEKTELELNEWKSPAAVANRAAQQRADTAKAEKSALDTRFSEYAGAVPDLSKISPGSTTVDTGTQLFGSALVLLALTHASGGAAEDIASAVPDKSKYVLVTTAIDLASTDAVYAQVADGLTQLVAAAKALAAPPLPARPAAAGPDETFIPESLVAAGVVGAAAAVLPAVVSLFSANRKISGASVNADDTQAVMSVATAMIKHNPPIKVLMDDFRTAGAAGTGHISRLLSDLSTQRIALEKRKAALGAEDTATAASIGQLTAAIDAFLSSVMAVPSGATRSACTTAILREQLHDGTIDRVVLVKGVGGATAQVVTDRPLWFKDKFTSIASAGLSWLMLTTVDGAVVAGGSKVSTLEMKGTIGADITFSPARSLPT